MTEKSNNNKVYYSFIISYYHHEITITISNDEKYVDINTIRTAFYGHATRSTEILNVDLGNF